MRELAIGPDGNWTDTGFKSRYSAELANGLAQPALAHARSAAEKAHAESPDSRREGYALMTLARAQLATGNAVAAATQARKAIAMFTAALSADHLNTGLARGFEEYSLGIAAIGKAGNPDTQDGVTIISLMGLLLYTDWQLTLICFTAIPAAAFSIRYTGKRLRGLSRNQQQAMAETTQVLEEAINGQRIVKIFGGQAYESKRFHTLANQLRLNGVKQVASSSINTGLTQLMVSIALAVVIYLPVTRKRRLTMLKNTTMKRYMT